jgi:adenosine deaminase CECR1
MDSDNADWELEEGLPQFEDPFIQQYLKGRDALIAEEQKRRHGEITIKHTFTKREYDYVFF